MGADDLLRLLESSGEIRSSGSGLQNGLQVFGTSGGGQIAGGTRRGRRRAGVGRAIRRYPKPSRRSVGATVAPPNLALNQHRGDGGGGGWQLSVGQLSRTDWYLEILALKRLFDFVQQVKKTWPVDAQPKRLKFAGMKKSPEFQSLENSIASLVATMTDVINAKIQASLGHEGPGLPKKPADSPHKNEPPPGFISFDALLAAVPLSARTLRAEIRRGRIPAIRLPGGRRFLFHLPSVERALLRFQRGGIE